MTTSQAENIKGARATQKLLLIDGDRDSAGQVRDFLGQHQYTVRVVSTAREAARILEAESDISLIITDFSVERQDAFEILRLIRSQRQYSKIPVLVCSEVGDKETVVRAYELGARDFMVKPVNPQILLTKVQRALQAHIRTVLIVDDNEMITDILARILEIDGYRTIVALFGAQAL
jgi:DNA-binding response OmpR family regulator